MIINNPDTRAICTSLDGAPYAAIALIQSYYNDYPNAVGFGTGFLIAPGRLASAAHVFWNDLEGNAPAPRLPDTVKVFVGTGLFDGHPELTFEVQLPSQALRVHPNFYVGDLTCDMATLDLSAAPTAASPILGFPADLASGDAVTVSGFPLKPPLNSGMPGPFGEYEAAGPLVDIGTPVFNHRVDTSDGQSGAPVRILRGDAWLVVGIHLGDADPGPGGSARNRARALTPDAVTWLHGSSS